MKSLWCLVFVAGCSSSPVNAAGTYSISITNGANGCNFADYTVGNQTTGIPLVITQSGSSATGMVMGAAAVDLGLITGSANFLGTIDGDNVDLNNQGTLAKNTGNCAYTYNAAIVSTLQGDELMGQVQYTAATNNNSDCSAIQGCSTVQDFNGTRPPQ